jgi:TrmH family RNA methyltransferase
MLDRVRIVLVRPIRPGNLGAVCRAMVNMGLSELVLVSPECARDDEQARGFAARAKPLLERARTVDSVAAALDGCVRTFATSAKGGMYRRQAGVTAAAGAALALDAVSAGRVAIAFGPEDRGLVMRELLEFDRVIEIPADPEYPVLNLAAAATVMCYELRQEFLRRAGGVRPALNGEPPASDERKRALYAKLFAALDEIGFFGGQQNPDHLKFALRRIFGRVDLTVNEVDILIGMTQQIRWYVERHPRVDKPLY